MKKFIALTLAFLMILSLTGCSDKVDPTTANNETESVEQTQTATQTDGTTQQTDTEPETQVEEVTYSGELRLNVVEMNFSLVGEKTDIYCGTLPREAITWKSNDELVAMVDNGVVTAVGVGMTTVTAEYQDQKMECAISCVAETKSGLSKTDKETLSQPKKLPPEGDGSVCHFYDDAAFIGDSVSYSLMLWAAQTGELGDATFLVRGGNGIAGYVNYYCTIGYQGAEMSIEDAVQASGVKKVFIMMGVNDLGFMDVEETMDYYRIMVDRILEKSPDVQIYVESCLPVWEKGIQGATNKKVDAFNELLVAYAEEKGFPYVEMASYIKDHTGGMVESYCSDFTTHMNYDGTDVWMQALKLYAMTQEVEE